MRCHYCDHDAAIVVEQDGVRVGVCEEHFRERLDELADSRMLESLGEKLDVERE